MGDEQQIRELLKLVIDPELGVNIVDLGLVYEIKCNDEKIYIRMTLTTPGCPMHDTIVGGVKRTLRQELGANDVEVEVVWQPLWSPDKMTQEAKEYLGFL